MRAILINEIAPGFSDTVMGVVNVVNELKSDWFRQNPLESRHLLLLCYMLFDLKEAAGIAHFVAGPDATQISGYIITVDGGLTMTFQRLLQRIC